MKLILQQKVQEKYEVVPSGITKAPCGLEVAKQHISWKGLEKDCYMFVYGAHDETARRIFVLPEDRKLFMEQAKKDQAEKSDSSSSIDLDDDADIEIDQEKLEEIKYKRLGAMLRGSETWMTDKFDQSE